jgi:TIR domain
MRLFISWSGERSHEMAKALHEWIPLVLHYVEPWLSQANIEAGQRWAEQVAKELESTNFGIICVTQENVASPWVLFEAGALAKSMQGARVVPLLLDLDIRDITGPLAQFQAKKADRSGLSDVIQSLNRGPENLVPEDKLNQLLEALFPQIEKKIGTIPKAASTTKHSRPQNEVLEELVASVRSLDSRMREQSDEGIRSSRRRGPRFHPFMLQEIAHLLGEGPDDPIMLLIIASLVREEIPWLYELGLEAYRSSEQGNKEKCEYHRRKFIKAVNMTLRGPFPPDEFGIDARMIHMLLREIDRPTEIESPHVHARAPRMRKKDDKKPG